MILPHTGDRGLWYNTISRPPPLLLPKMNMPSNLFGILFRTFSAKKKLGSVIQNDTQTPPFYQKWTRPITPKGSVIQSDKQTSPLLPKVSMPSNLFGNVSKKKKKIRENFFDLEKYMLEKWTHPITPEISISQKISLVSKLFRLKRSTKKVSCEFSENRYLKSWNFGSELWKIFTQNFFFQPGMFTFGGRERGMHIILYQISDDQFACIMWRNFKLERISLYCSIVPDWVLRQKYPSGILVNIEWGFNFKIAQYP